jgi:hypothetical protein
MACEFPVAGDDCENTCTGRPNVDPTKDPDYRTFKDLYNCMSDKCIVQMKKCEGDPSCKRCFEEDAPDFCFTLDSFDAVIDCAMCSCTDKAGSEYCATGGSDKKPIAPDDSDERKPVPCTAAETIAGSNAVIKFSQCTEFDEVGMMIKDFDNNNFGQLDAFEACAHSFAKDEDHGGRTALGCMQILSNAMTTPVSDKGRSDAPKEAIMALAKKLYHDAESFCDCAKDSSEACPQCPSFHNFKTLLFESLDACKALDEIDCDAWSEFYYPCKVNLEKNFNKIDLDNKKGNRKNQCNFIKDNCGGAGTFPAFRRLDCAGEISKEAWDFHNEYVEKCLSGDDGIPPEPSPPSPAPPTPDDKPSGNMTPSPTRPPYTPSDGPKPYVPSGSKGSSSHKKKSHFWRWFFFLGLAGGGGYYYYKQRMDSFNFYRYRRTRNFDYDADESAMYSALNNSTSFQPPSLPPTPAYMQEMT